MQREALAHARDRVKHFIREIREIRGVFAFLPPLIYGSA
jgi:hypothetical protein